MSPREEDGQLKGAAVQKAPANGYYSAFWNRLSAIPVVQGTIQTTVDVYSTSKERHALLGKGLGYLEYGVGLASTNVYAAANAIVEKYPAASTAATKLDNLACSCLETIETKVPVLQKPPKQIVASVKKGTSTALHNSVRGVLKTYPGQKVVKALDAMIAWSELRLELQEAAESVSKGTEQEEDAGDETSQEVSKKDPPVLTLKNGAVISLKAYLQLLKLVKHTLINLAGLKARPASPRKPVDVSRRKKASPKKRLPQRNLVSRVTNSAMALLGLRKQEDIIVDELCAHLQSSDNVNERNEKRKHDECVDTESSDSDSLNLGSALDNYISDEDSDYVPEDLPSDDSANYSSGEEESDIEVEVAGKGKDGKPLKQIVDKKVKNVASSSVTSISASTAAAPNDDSSGPKVVLQPEWKANTEQSNTKA